MGAITGNALGAPFEGMSRGHIASHFRDITGYTDPGPALKQNIIKWRKPGLYTAPSQLMIMLYYSMVSRGGGTRQFEDDIRSGAGKGESDFGIFRNPGPAEGLIIRRLKEPDTPEELPPGPPYPDCSCIPVLLPLVYYFHESHEICMLRGLEYARKFSTDDDTAAGSLVFLHLLSSLMKADPGTTASLEHASCAIQELPSVFAGYASKFFALGCNPDAVLRGIERYHAVLSSMSAGTPLREAESAILSAASPFMKTPATRATVNHPLLQLPFAWHIAASYISNPGESLFAATREGGHASSLCMLTGTFSGALQSGTDWIPGTLISGLVNKTRILALGQAFADGKKTKEDLSAFIEAEQALTQKSYEEYNSKLRHYKPKTKKPKSRRDQEKELSRHVVESWTKLDRAKWKKQRKKQDDHNK